jgi:hypothetical protein
MTTTRSVVDGLKGNPLALALIVINVLYLGAGLIVYREQQTRISNLVRTMIQECMVEKP